MAVPVVRSIINNSSTKGGGGLLGNQASVDANIQELVSLMTKMKLMDIQNKNEQGRIEQQGKVYTDLENLRSANDINQIGLTGTEHRKTTFLKGQLDLHEDFQKAILKAKEDGKLEALDQAWYQAQEEGDPVAMKKIQEAMTARTAKIAAGFYCARTGQVGSPEIYQAMLSLGDRVAGTIHGDISKTADYEKKIKYEIQPNQKIKSDANQIEAFKAGMAAEGKGASAVKDQVAAQRQRIVALRSYYLGQNIPLDIIDASMQAIQITRPTNKANVAEDVRAEVLKRLSQFEGQLSETKRLDSKQQAQIDALWSIPGVEVSWASGKSLPSGGPEVRRDELYKALYDQQLKYYQTKYLPNSPQAALNAKADVDAIMTSMGHGAPGGTIGLPQR